MRPPGRAARIGRTRRQERAMPLHLLPIMLAVLAFMLWIAFQDGDESELLELGEGEDGR